MKNQELFDKTVAILVKAYHNGTLQHGTPCACAVGNLVYQPKTIREIENLEKNRTEDWYDNIMELSSKNLLGDSQIKATGYSTKQILEIEHSFEIYPMKLHNKDKDGYLGLMSVVDCLMEMHEATKEEAQKAKQLFVLTT